MTVSHDVNIDALCHTARDISRHIAGMADELLSIHHADTTHDSEMVPRQINKIRDQIALLSAVVEDIAGPRKERLGGPCGARLWRDAVPPDPLLQRATRDKARMKSAFVTGGSGFVGRALIQELTARGIPTRGLARSPKAAEAVQKAGAEPVMGDLADEAAMQAGMSGAEIVIHAAAKVEDWGPPAAFQAATIDGTRSALRAARAAGVTRFVHIGTEAVLAAGGPILRADETTPYPAVPNGLYPWSKGQAERDVIAANSDNFSTVSVRPRFIWGRGDTTLLPQISRAMQSGAWAWFGGGHHLSSTCHVRNVVEGALLAAEHGPGGEIYFLTDGAPVEFRDFITRLAATQGVMAPAREMPMWLVRALAAGGEFAWKTLSLPGRPLLTRTAVNLMFMEVTVNDTKARRALGYTSHVSIEQGLAELSADHLARAA